MKPNDAALIAAAHERIEAERTAAVRRTPREQSVEALKQHLSDAWDAINDLSLLFDPSRIAESDRAGSLALVRERAQLRRSGGGTGRISMHEAMEILAKKECSE